LGDVGAGKTLATIKLIYKLLELGYTDITIIDMAPSIKYGVGGLICELAKIPNNITYIFSKDIIPPRSCGRNAKETLYYAKRNMMSLKKLLQYYLENPTEILIINDLSMYLHKGGIGVISKCIEVSKTFIGNSYYGVKLAFDHGSGISRRERRLIDKLMELVDMIIFKVTV